MMTLIAIIFVSTITAVSTNNLCDSGDAIEFGIMLYLPVSVDQFRCLLRNNYTYFLGRLQHSNGYVDTIGINNTRRAREGKYYLVNEILFVCVFAAGYRNVSGYLFTKACANLASCLSAHLQVMNVYNALQTADVQIDTLWLVIEYRDEWSPCDDDNKRFFCDLIAAAQVEDLC